jgi:hypothetical protein
VQPGEHAPEVVEWKPPTQVQVTVSPTLIVDELVPLEVPVNMKFEIFTDAFAASALPHDRAAQTPAIESIFFGNVSI